MSSATSNTSIGFCSTSTIDSPLSFSLRMVAITSATICGASPSDGSSISSTRGLPISARPIASICCSPPDRCAAICFARSARRGNIANTVSAVHGACLLPASGLRAATMRFSRTVRLLKMRRPCGTSATPRAATISGDSPVTGVAEHRNLAAARRQQAHGDVHAGRFAGAVAARAGRACALRPARTTRPPARGCRRNRRRWLAG